MDARTLQPIIGNGLVGAIAAAERTGLLAAVASPATCDELAARLGLDPRATRLLLDALCAVGHLEREDGRYRRPAQSALDAWPDMDAFVRTGAVTPDIDDRERRGAAYSRTVLALAELFTASASELAAQLGDAGTILDVGAGSGVWSLEMARRSTRTHVVALDLVDVLPCFRALADGYGLAERVSTIAGSYFTVEPPQSIDRVVLANVLHLETEDEAAALVARFARSIGDAGELVIVDSVPGASFERRVAHAVYGLHLGMRTARGKPHALERLQAWCAAAGLPHQRLIELGRSGGALVALVASRTVAAERQPDTTTIATAELEGLERALERALRRQRYIFGGATDALMAIRYSLDRVVSVNAAFQRLFGVDWGEEEIHDYRDVVAPADRERFAALIDEMRHGVLRERRHHFVLQRGDGTSFDAEVTCFDPSYRTGLFFVRDRTEMARAEKMQALGALVAGVAHDLNTPLGALLSGADLVSTLAQKLAVARPAERARLGVSLEETAATLRRSVERIDSMVRSLGAYAQLDGAALRDFAPRFGSGMARAVCERVADRRSSP